ncbi:MAG: Crp/Fnr family transcriptional regulator [Peptoniphilaceae bacterium]|nr:Crp/Fnr family transcriptional regulator [Peptoniphilaceae bacterium]
MKIKRGLMDIKSIPIFKNLTDKDIRILEKTLQIEEKIYKKNSYIFMQNDKAKNLYYLLEGDIIVSKVDFNGKRSIVQNFKDKVLFGEIYAYLNETYDFSAMANEDSKVLAIKDFKKIFSIDLDRSFLLSFIDLIAKKCLLLSRKNQINTQFTLRQKIANYLIYNEEKNVVNLEMTREELADFLATTRPSLSRELSKMKSEGIIDVKGKIIKILDKDTIYDLTY